MTRDQFLCEQMGKCWHTFSQSRSNYAGWVCSKCGERSKMLPHVRPADGINFSTSPADILALQQWVMGQEWWDEFKDWSWDKAPDDDNDWVAYLWRNLATLIVEYHGEGR